MLSISLQYIKDVIGNEALDRLELSLWHKQFIDERLNDYYKKSEDVVDFEKTIDAIKKAI